MAFALRALGYRRLYLLGGKPEDWTSEHRGLWQTMVIPNPFH